MKNHLNTNLSMLRKYHGYTQEEVASKINVTRQAVAKWESGDSTPDIINCMALSELYGISIDELVSYDQKEVGVPIPPRDKHIFGVVTVGERGQMVIPKKAREIFDINPGDSLMVLGDTNPDRYGIAIIKAEGFLEMFSAVNDAGKEGEQ
ncbi:MAG: helix-turn-helix domain-containing protein [Eubacterium sp.]